jgi:hypothetical protein
VAATLPVLVAVAALGALVAIGASVVLLAARVDPPTTPPGG